MIRVIPSLSILNGRTAKVDHSDFKNAHLFDRNPVDLAKMFEESGAEWLHFVDLDGAQSEKVKSDHILSVISGQTGLKVSFSGGIRTSEDIAAVLKAGAKTVTIATIAATQPDLFMDWVITYGPNRLVLGADVSNGKVVARGWQGSTNIDLWEHLQWYSDRSLQFAKITDIDRDGLLEGPNFELYEEAVRRFPTMNIVASGGVRSIADIERLNDIGVWGVIVARALYEDKIDLHELAPFFNGEPAK